MDNSTSEEQKKHNKATCPYCQKLQASEQPGSSLANCPYCQKIDEPAEILADCPYCAAMEEQSSACPYCADTEVRQEMPSVQNPTTTDSQDYAGQDLDAPALPKPMPGDELPIEAAPYIEDTTNNNANLEGQGEITVTSDQPKEAVQVDQSKEAMMDIARQIEGAPSPVDAAKQVDSTQLAVGTSMQDNVSRPGGYGDNTPGDMGLADDGQDQNAPDLTSVLHEGLDAHADNIQRERVVQMVSSALQGFKASKQIIERSQQQAPQLYQSSIMMLKAMIEMAKMLGLGPSADQENPVESQPQSEWQDPFPTHPDQGGNPQPGQAPAEGSASNTGDANNGDVAGGSEWSNPFPTHPENGGEGGVGQAISKLPTSATTQHVAKQPITPGSVNAQGQMRYVDPETKKESFIDMKQGRVLSPSGKPVKPAQG